MNARQKLVEFDYHLTAVAAAARLHLRVWPFGALAASERGAPHHAKACRPRNLQEAGARAAPQCLRNANPRRDTPSARITLSVAAVPFPLRIFGLVRGGKFCNYFQEAAHNAARALRRALLSEAKESII